MLHLSNFTRRQKCSVLGKVETRYDMIYTMSVNACDPFILISKLRSHMSSKQRKNWDINVSSMEGRFRTDKGPQHPHTNMAKAALNMMTHTSSRDYAFNNIFMNATDTGWVTNENLLWLQKKNRERGIHPLLDEIDSAAHV
jgi:NAD(P)-dependent dehydrogenase (short-subunit alcohol dehydrogenase family)